MTSDSPLSLNQLRSAPAGDASASATGPQTPTTSSFKASKPFSSKITAVLATSYADSEFRDALSLLDKRGIANYAAVRRQLRLHLQKEVIDSNGDIISEFGKVADVSLIMLYVNAGPGHPYLTLHLSNSAGLVLL